MSYCFGISAREMSSVASNKGSGHSMCAWFMFFMFGNQPCPLLKVSRVGTISKPFGLIHTGEQGVCTTKTLGQMHKTSQDPSKFNDMWYTRGWGCLYFATCPEKRTLGILLRGPGPFKMSNCPSFARVKRHLFFLAFLMNPHMRFS